MVKLAYSSFSGCSMASSSFSTPKTLTFRWWAHLVKVAVHDLHEVGDALVLAVAQGIGVDGLGVGDAVQCPVVGQLGNGVQGGQQAVGLGAVARVAAGGNGV